jgi:hypothetical protein
MSQKQLVAVTIPIYKSEIDKYELISLTQCLKVLAKHPIIFFAPESLDVSFYKSFCVGKIDIKIERFDNFYFSGIPSYNKLMLSKLFYQRFSKYENILIYQLDAFVFRDELEYWCKKGYYYIGAPYTFVDLDTYPIKFLTKYRALLKFLTKIGLPIYSYRHVGNGGLSLRSIPKTLQLLSICSKSAKNWTTLMEDNFFMYWGNVLFPFFRLAPEIEAAKFCIELNPRETFEMIGNKIPFGTHAYLKYDFKFWKEFIINEE